MDLAAGEAANDMSPDPVRYSDGSIKYAVTDFASDAFGLPWGRTRSWTNQTQSPGINGYHSVAQTLNGNGWFASEVPRIQWEFASGGSRPDGSRIILVNSATDFRYFDRLADSGTGALSYSSVIAGAGKIAVTSYVGTDPTQQNELTYLDGNGNQLVFYGKAYTGTNGESELRGSIKSFTSAAGQTVNFEYEQAGGHWRLKAMHREQVVNGTNVRESFFYAYVRETADSPLPGRFDYQFLLRSVTWKRGAYTAGQPDTRPTIRTTTYQYWGDAVWYGWGMSPDIAGTQYGQNLDLASATTSDGNGNVIDQYVYRYWKVGDTDFETKGNPGSLKYVFSPSSVSRLAASLPSGVTPFTATDAQVAPYADNYFEYGLFRYNRSSLWQYDQVRVTKEVVQAAGCSCSGGSAQGSYSYTYSENLKPDPNYPQYPGSPYYGEDYNVWKFKTVMSEPDGSQTEVYANFAGMPILSVKVNGSNRWNTFYRYDAQGRVILKANPSALTNLPAESAWGTYSSGGAAGFKDIGAFNATTGDLGIVSDSTGLVERWEFASSTSSTISESVSGDAAGFLKAYYVQQGDGGGSLTPAVKQSAHEYVRHQFTNQGGGTADMFVLAKTTNYAGAGATGPETTTWEYSWDAGSSRLRELRTNLPVITTGENGSGSGDYTIAHFDANGLVNWYRDADGFLQYRRFDALTSLPTLLVRDVNTSRDSDSDGDDDELSSTQLQTFEAKPAGTNWTRSGGANLVTQYKYDAFGRALLETRALSLADANHDSVPDDRQATAVAYNDVSHETRVYEGWTGSGAVGPITMTREYRPVANAPSGQQSLYYETAVLSVTPSIANGLPTGTEAFNASNVLSLSRSITNAGGIVTKTDNYSSLKNLTYSAAQSQLGAKGVNFIEIVSALNDMGQKMMSTSPDGTIRWSVFDSRGLLISKWTGTNASGATPYDPTGGGAAGNNMMKVTSYLHNDESQVIESRDWFGIGASDYYRTRYEYDFRGRLIGKVGPDGVGERYTLDNEGHQTKLESFAGTTVNADGTLNYGAASNLRGRTDTFYDDQGRLYRTTTYKVDPANGTVGSSITQNTFYDRRGDVVKTASANGLFQKRKYDGLGRVVSSYVSYDDAETTWADALTVTGDTVVSQQDTIYVADRPVISTSFDRTAATGPTTGALTKANARLNTSVSWYDAAGRVIASGSYGTDPDNRVFGSGGAIVDANADGVPDIYTAGAPTSNSASGQLFVILAKTTFDDAGRVLSSTDNKGHLTLYTYDLLGRRTKMVENAVGTGPNLGVVTATDSDTNRTTEWFYDPWGRLNILRATNPQGSGNPIQYEDTQYFYAFDDGLDPDTIPDQWVTYAIYPDSGNDRDVDGNGNVETSQDAIVDFDWDSAGNGFIDSGSPNNFDFVKETFDRLGRKTSSTDQRGVTHTYTYDPAKGYLTADVVTDLGRTDQNVDGAVRAIGYGYDDLGRQQTVTTFSNTAMSTIASQVKLAYDGWGNVIKSQQSHSGAVDANTPAVQYTYDDGAVNTVAKYVRLSKVTYPNGRELNYLYGGDAANNKLNRVYEIGGDTSDTDSTFDARYFYSGTGTILRELRANTTSKLDYDPSANGTMGGFDRFGRVVGQTWYKNTGTASSPTWAATDATAYTYDENSNRTNRVSSTNGNGLTDPYAYQQSYAYDGLDRLTSSADSKPNSGGTAWVGTNGQTWGGLDALGNWRTSGTDTNGDGTTDLTQTRTHNAANEITGVSGSGATWGTPTYDYAGNLTRLPPATGSSDAYQIATYDAWNHQVGVKGYTSSNVLTNTTVNKFDGQGRRISGNAGEVYFNEGWQEIETRNSAGTPTEQTIYSLRYVDAPLFREALNTGATAGTLDTSFSGDGKDVLDISGSTDYGRRVVIQSDGKILVAGRAGATGYTMDFAVVRYNTDGTLDATWGTNGVVRTAIGSWDEAYSIALTSTGKVVVVGNVDGTVGIVRYNSNGTLDTTFDGDGKLQLYSATWYTRCVLIDSSDRIIVSGQKGANGSYSEGFVVRVNANGTTDTTWNGGNGPVTLLASLNIRMVNGMTFDASGKIVVCGVGKVPGDNDNFAVARLNANGTLDTAFNSTGGRVIQLGAGGDSAWDVAVDSSGKIILAGRGGTSSAPYTSTYAVVRLNADGSLDTSFNSTGKINGATFAYASDDGAYAVSAQPDGKIVVAGYSTLSGGNTDFAIARYNANGTLDTSFGAAGTGRATADFGATGDVIYSMVRDASGRFVVVGTAGDDMGIARFNGVTQAGGTGTQRQWMQQDANFNVTSIADSAGAVLERYRYTPYGERSVWNAVGSSTLPASSLGNFLGFQGGRLDSSTGQLLFNDGGFGREYLAAIGLWTQRDRHPSGPYQNGGNIYAYVQGNPLARLDATGTSWASDLWETFKYNVSLGAAADGLGFNGFDVAAGYWTGALKGEVDGAFAWVNGLIPFWDPIPNSWFFEPCDPMLEVSEFFGNISREAWLAALGAKLWTGPRSSLLLEEAVADGWWMAQEGELVIGGAGRPIMEMRGLYSELYETAEVVLAGIPSKGQLGENIGRAVYNCFTGATGSILRNFPISIFLPSLITDAANVFADDESCC